MNKIALLFLLFLASCSEAVPENAIILVSTTSTQDSGLLDVLLPAFTQQTGYQVSLIATGSGQALKIAEQGNADVILLNSPQAELKFMQEGFGVDRRPVMHNDFVIVGPSADPASIRAQPTALAAFKGIFASASTFVSRGDESGTHVKEMSLWDQAGLDPVRKDWYLETGQGQGATLSIASEKQGYALTDRGTFLAYRSNVNLVILFEGDPILLNVYHVITVNPEIWPHVNLMGAQTFADFVTSSEGQRIISEYEVAEYGQPLFIPDAGSESP